MTVQLNHTIVWCHDKKKSAEFLAEILGLPAPRDFYNHFLVVDLANGVSLDFSDDGDVAVQHYAFLISEQEFDAVFARIKERDMTYWADPARKQTNKINHHDGGRGMYFLDPNGHVLEVITRPYGSGG